LILDKGFNDKECKELMQQKNINYLIPIKLDFAVKKLNLKTGFKTSFSYDEDTIRAKKMNVNDKTYYCFKSTFA
ncbi:IS1634 family transposase, partial [Mycoplasma mycoides]|nr:IS1634 family transposase [Mycoplasma mycoides]